MAIEGLEKFKRTSDDVPKIIGRAPVSVNEMQGRVHFHEFGFKNAYGSFSGGVEHITEVLKEGPEFLDGVDYFLGGLWGDDGDKMIDFFKYSGLGGDWSANPEMSSYVLRNGVYQPEDRAVTCGDGLIILGAEERHRRTTSGLADYIKSAPVIDGLRNE